jgi:regulator of sigma E protease
MLTVIYLILMLGVLIFVHELGHFIAAKKIGVYVGEFALGMGPKIFSFKRKKHNDPTVYSLRLFPIGGFCAMAGESVEDEKGLKKNQYMCNRSKWERFLILIAGVTMNIIFAFILLFAQGLIWGHTEQNTKIGYVPDGYPASKAGIQVGDTITKVNGHHVNTWDKLTIMLNLKTKSKTYDFTVTKKNGTTKTYKITPKVEKTKDGNETKVFGIGAGSKIYKGFFSSLKYAFTKLGSIIASMWIILGALFTGKLGLSSLSGPVGMYTVVGESAKYGLQSIMYLTAYLSINLAVINALPFPAFDGGRILFVCIEAITGKKVNQNVEATIHTIGFVLLMILMLYITYRDILRLI